MLAGLVGFVQVVAGEEVGAVGLAVVGLILLECSVLLCLCCVLSRTGL